MHLSGGVVLTTCTIYLPREANSRHWRPPTPVRMAWHLPTAPTGMVTCMHGGMHGCHFKFFLQLRASKDGSKLTPPAASSATPKSYSPAADSKSVTGALGQSGPAALYKEHTLKGGESKIGAKTQPPKLRRNLVNACPCRRSYRPRGVARGRDLAGDPRPTTTTTLRGALTVD